MGNITVKIKSSRNYTAQAIKNKLKTKIKNLNY